MYPLPFPAKIYRNSFKRHKNVTLKRNKLHFSPIYYIKGELLYQPDLRCKVKHQYSENAYLFPPFQNYFYPINADNVFSICETYVGHNGSVSSN